MRSIHCAMSRSAGALATDSSRTSHRRKYAQSVKCRRDQQANQRTREIQRPSLLQRFITRSQRQKLPSTVQRPGSQTSRCAKACRHLQGRCAAKLLVGGQQLVQTRVPDHHLLAICVCNGHHRRLAPSRARGRCGQLRPQPRRHLGWERVSLWPPRRAKACKNPPPSSSGNTEALAASGK